MFTEPDIGLGLDAFEEPPGFPDAFESGFGEGRETLAEELREWLKDQLLADRQTFKDLQRAGDHLAANVHAGRVQAWEGTLQKLAKLR